MTTRQRKSYRLQKKRSPLWKNKTFWTSVSLFVFFLGIFYTVFFSPFLQLNHIRVEGNEGLASDEIERISDSILRRNVLFVEFRHMLLFSSTQIEGALREAFPQGFLGKTPHAESGTGTH